MSLHADRLRCEWFATTKIDDAKVSMSAPTCMTGKGDLSNQYIIQEQKLLQRKLG